MLRSLLGKAQLSRSLSLGLGVAAIALFPLRFSSVSQPQSSPLTPVLLGCEPTGGSGGAGSDRPTTPEPPATSESSTLS